MSKLNKEELAIYQGENGEILLKEDISNETVWASLDQIALLFGRNKSTISRHINNIFKEEELDEKLVVAFFATTTKHGYIKGKTQTKQVEYFNLDMIISVGYRVNGKIATNFRKWATGVLKQHITQGWTINKKIIEKNYNKFMEAVEDLKKISSGKDISNDDVLELVSSFATTWFNLESFDKGDLPAGGFTQKELKIEVKNLYKDIEILKKDLIRKNLATEMFAQEKNIGSLEGIFGNIMQTVFGKEAYPTIEEKAAHFIYFIIKNHPFNDGNKRTGAFAFIWFLQKYGYDFTGKITPEALTSLTLLIAQSDPKEKEKIVGLILLLLK